MGWTCRKKVAIYLTSLSWKRKKETHKKVPANPFGLYTCDSLYCEWSRTIKQVLSGSRLLDSSKVSFPSNVFNCPKSTHPLPWIHLLTRSTSSMWRFRRYCPRRHSLEPVFSIAGESKPVNTFLSILTIVFVTYVTFSMHFNETSCIFNVLFYCLPWSKKGSASCPACF